MQKNNLLFSDYALNSKLTLKNRIVMAPMTRSKAGVDHTATTDMAAYYGRRADAGLIITEGTIISRDASGYPTVPGIFTEEQISHWRQVTEAVHANNGRIFLQLWHVGRVSHPHFLNGQLPLSASETMMSGKVSRSPGLTYGKSRAASLEEIENVITNFANGAKNAIAAGFDGVEIHGANGYLIDQFLHYHTNKRTDEFGGSPENMTRLALRIVHAIGKAIGYERVGIRLSPAAYLNEIIGDERDHEVFSYLLQQLNQLPIAYVHTGNFNDSIQYKELQNKTMTAFMRQYYQGTLIAAGCYTKELAQQAINQNEFDLVAIGRPFIANPDLIRRLRDGSELMTYDVSMLESLN